MYATFLNHFENFIRLAIAFGFLFAFYPNRLFDNTDYGPWERVYANAMKMMVLIIVSGYLLVLTRMYEFIGLSLVLLLVFIYRNVIHNDKYHIQLKRQNMYIYLFDLLEHRHDLIRELEEWVTVKWRIWLKEKAHQIKVASHMLWLWGAVISTFALSAYIRFYDAAVNAAPAMSDSYVTLAWIKYIIRRQLFHDGIYPQGFSIYLATIHKFAFIDPLYLVKYIGPLNELLIIAAIGFVVAKWLKSNWLGVFSAMVYGVFIWAMPIDWERQVATNSQEFGFAWVLPTFYFVSRYFSTKKRNDLVTAFCGLTTIALVHMVASLFVGAGVVLLAFCHLLVERTKAFRGILEIAAAGFLAAIIGLIPEGIGLLMGKTFHGSSVEYLTRMANMGNPVLLPIEKVAVGCLVPILLFVVIQGIRRRLQTEELFLSLLVMGTFGAYYYLGALTGSVMLQTRLTEVWGLVLPIALALPLYIITHKIEKSQLRNLPIAFVTVGMLIASVTIFTPKPMIPYKMERNESVEQYIRITKSLRPTQWLAVSQDEGYAVVLGSGHHLMVADWMKEFDPVSPKLIDKKTNSVYKINDVFIFNEKKVFRTYFPNLQPMYDQREKDRVQMDEWVKAYGAVHKNMKVYYEDDNLTIYQIHQGLSMSDMYENIWGLKPLNME